MSCGRRLHCFAGCSSHMLQKLHQSRKLRQDDEHLSQDATMRCKVLCPCCVTMCNSIFKCVQTCNEPRPWAIPGQMSFLRRALIALLNWEGEEMYETQCCRLTAILHLFKPLSPLQPKKSPVTSASLFVGSILASKKKKKKSKMHSMRSFPIEELCLEEIHLKSFECSCSSCLVFRSDKRFLVSTLYWGLLFPGCWLYGWCIFFKLLFLHPNAPNCPGGDQFEAVVDHEKNRSKLWDYLGYCCLAISVELIIVCCLWAMVNNEPTVVTTNHPQDKQCRKNSEIDV